MAVKAEQMLLQCEFDGEHYALLLDELSQIILLDNVLNLPKTPPCIFGLGNYKGKILTIVNVPYLVSKEMPVEYYVGVLTGNLAHIGLVLGNKIQTLMVSITQIKPLSEERAGLPGNEILEGEFLLNGNLLFIISIEKLYQVLCKEIQAYVCKDLQLSWQN